MEEINTIKQYIGLSPLVCKMSRRYNMLQEEISCSEMHLQIEVANSPCAYLNLWHGEGKVFFFFCLLI